MIEITWKLTFTNKPLHYQKYQKQMLSLSINLLIYKIQAMHQAKTTQQVETIYQAETIDKNT